MRTAARVDANHKRIVEALRGIGCSVQSLAAIGKGCPDLLVGFRGRNYVIEIKDGDKPPSKRRLTPDEEVWHETWNGHVMIVESVTQAFDAIGVNVK